MGILSKEKKRALIKTILPPVGNLVIRLLKLTCTNRFHLPENLPENTFIVAFWHGELLMQPFTYRKIRKRPKIKVLISEHFDGEIITRIISYFGFETLRGSSSKGAKRMLIGALKSLDEGYDLAITPDGPRGPRHSVADGIVAIARKKKAQIIVFRSRASRCWNLNSWDKFVIPKPFSVIDYYALEPFRVDGMEFEEAREYIKKKMLEDVWDEEVK